MRIPKVDEVRKLLGALDMGQPVNVIDDRGELSKELKFLVALAETNFAACFNASVPDDNTLVIAVSDRNTHMVAGGGQIIDDTCRWLRAKATENCLCGAPAFITGCDCAYARGNGETDSCMCRTGECPWTKHLGTFI